MNIHQTILFVVKLDIGSTLTFEERFVRKIREMQVSNHVGTFMFARTKSSIFLENDFVEKQ